MNWEVVAALAEAVGAFAVVISLVYLTIQVRQGTNVARATYDIAQSGNYRNVAMAIVESAEVSELFHRGLADPESLTAVEYQRFGWMMGELYQHYRTQVEGRQAGLVTKEREEQWASFMASLVAMPGGRENWERGTKGFLEDEVRAGVERALSHTPPWNEIMPSMFKDERKRAGD